MVTVMWLCATSSLTRNTTTITGPSENNDKEMKTGDNNDRETTRRRKRVEKGPSDVEDDISWAIGKFFLNSVIFFPFTN
jgi:hypothetical protein